VFAVLFLCATILSKMIYITCREKPKKRLPLAITYRADPNTVTQQQLNDDVLQESGVFITQVCVMYNYAVHEFTNSSVVLEINFQSVLCFVA